MNHERERVWRAHIDGSSVTVRHYAVLAPGEDLVDNPPTQTMTLAEWQLRHAEFDCDVTGMPLISRPGVGART